jgi:hypothetical protein
MKRETNAKAKQQIHPNVSIKRERESERERGEEQKK